MTEGEAPGQRAGSDDLVERVATQAAFDEVEIGRELADELTARRVTKTLLERYRQLTPAEKARMDTGITVFDDAENALHEGRAAYSRGELVLAAARMRVAAGHGLGDATVYLAAIYHHQGRPELADAWRTIAEADGRPVRDIANPPTD